MSFQRYQEAIEWLFSRRYSSKQRPSLENMKMACHELGNPQEHLRCIHVAGTNGKGSVCAKIARGFELSGVRVGLYTSPHLYSFCERIQISHENISEEAVVEGLSYITGRCSSIEKFSFFELTTLLSFWGFQKNHVEMAVIETGLGGRYDATNVCIPDMCVITSISLDHTELLGDTCEAIAREKAGIIKPKVPVVVGPRVPLEPIFQEAQESQVFVVRGTWADYDEENSQVAAMALGQMGVPQHIINEAILCRPLCRFQSVPIGGGADAPAAIIMDVAHNPDGIRRLLMKVKRSYPHVGLCVLLSISREKDVEAMVSNFQDEHTVVFCTQTASSRSVSAIELTGVAQKIGITARSVQDPGEAVEKALQYASKHGMVLLVTGTFFLMEQVRTRLPISTL